MHGGSVSKKERRCAQSACVPVILRSTWEIRSRSRGYICVCLLNRVLTTFRAHGGLRWRVSSARRPAHASPPSPRLTRLVSHMTGLHHPHVRPQQSPPSIMASAPYLLQAPTPPSVPTVPNSTGSLCTAPDGIIFPTDALALQAPPSPPSIHSPFPMIPFLPPQPLNSLPILPNLLNLLSTMPYLPLVPNQLPPQIPHSLPLAVPPVCFRILLPQAPVRPQA